MDTKELTLITQIIQKTVNESMAQLYIEIEKLITENKIQDNKFKKVVLEQIKALKTNSPTTKLNGYSSNTSSGKYVNENLHKEESFQDRIRSEYAELVQPKKRQITSNPMLNDLLNQTKGFTKAEMAETPDDGMGNATTMDQYINENVVVGTGGELVPITEKISTIIDATQRDYSGVLQRMTESANQTRGSVKLSTIREIAASTEIGNEEMGETPLIVDQSKVPAHLLD